METTNNNGQVFEETSVERMKKAYEVMKDTHSWFVENILPKEERKLRDFMSHIPKERQEEELKRCVDKIKQELYRSDFLQKRKCFIPKEEISMIGDVVSSDEEAEIVYHGIHSCHALPTFFGSDGWLKEDEFAHYIYENKITVPDMNRFYAYVDLSRIINEMSPTGNIEPIRSELPVNSEHKISTAIAQNSAEDNTIIIDEIYTDVLRKKNVFSAYAKVMHDYVIPKVQEPGGVRDAKWKWIHVYEALKDERLAFINSNVTTERFALAMERDDESITSKSIKQSFYRFEKSHTKNTYDENIITDIVNIFKVVMDIVEGN